jgi:LysR family transcriptional activator of nhaA
VIEKEIARVYQVKLVGEIPESHTQFYAISVERKLKNPAVVAITEAARTRFF